MASNFFFFIFFFFLPLLVQSSVPPEATFHFVNDGGFGDYVVEYGANYRVLSLANSPFQLCFYNTTNNAFTLALRMGMPRSESLMRWVWEFNRGNPVRENATFSLRSDGNLVLADADGRIAWQSNTANKGVVGFEVLANGNMVLHDSKGNFVWKSFDSATDTLLVGQSLKLAGLTKLISRSSAAVDSDGPYSLVMEQNGLSLYYKSPNSPKLMLYFNGWPSFDDTALQRVTFNSSPDDYTHDLTLDYKVGNLSTGRTIYLSRPKFNTSLSYLRLGLDGNIRIFTYTDRVDYGSWDATFTLFDSNYRWESECQLPEKCGKFGICEENQCVACPLESGLAGWSRNCEAKKVNSCNPKDFHYYKVEGVDHFLSKYANGEGPMKETDCGRKCSRDCKCLGYFYHGETSRCWIAYELKTMTKVAKSTHVGYIKAPNK